MLTGGPPPTTCSESPDSARPPHEAPLHHPAARAAAGDNHPALRLIRPLSPPWQSNWLIKPFPQQPARRRADGVMLRIAARGRRRPEGSPSGVQAAKEIPRLIVPTAAQSSDRAVDE